MSTIKTINGLLELNEDNDYVVNKGTGNEKNISQLLRHNWKYEIPATYSLSVGKKDYITEECVLQYKKSIGILYELHAESKNIEEKLFNACGKHIEFTITTGA
jgi:HD-like signal output (HDOD) protein